MRQLIVLAGIRDLANILPRFANCVIEIHLHLDNDDTGRRAALAVKYALEGYVICNEPPETGKDVNDWLTFNSHYRER